MSLLAEEQFDHETTDLGVIDIIPAHGILLVGQEEQPLASSALREQGNEHIGMIIGMPLHIRDLAFPLVYQGFPCF